MTTIKVDEILEPEQKPKRAPRRARYKEQQPLPGRRPEWLKVRAPTGESYENLKRLMRVKTLHTVCEEAHCPNIAECWERGTATFLMMGDVCTRSCGFCDIKVGRPNPLDWAEPRRVAEAVSAMNLNHAVITSVNRDERPDGGAPFFAMVIREIRRLRPGCTVEVLIPDFKGSRDALKLVVDAEPDILNHNVETVPRIFKKVQPQDNYEWALSTLDNTKKMNPKQISKSGIMVGLGETDEEVFEVMRDLVDRKVDILTIGQYLQPSRKHLAVERFVPPQQFAEYKRVGLEMGFRWVESGPLVRSSYNADRQARELKIAT